LFEQALPDKPSGMAEWHDALMDFGSAICTKRAPKCSECTLQAKCVAFASDTPIEELGPPKAKQAAFAGSLRMHRGAVLRVAVAGKGKPVPVKSAMEHVRPVEKRDPEKLAKAVAQLTAEGMIVATDDPAFVRVSGQ
jgi:A/G-specific adenine glycosylase